MSESKFKTLRHIETVRNYINAAIKELIKRQEQHDQTKLESPEVEIFEEYTPKLREITYGSSQYRKCLEEMKPAVNHHNSVNRHHPEHFKKFVCIICHREYLVEMPDHCDTCRNSQFLSSADVGQMTLIDLLEMLCDWKAAGMRHNDGDLYNSLKINKERFNIDDQLYQVLLSTAEWIQGLNVQHKANES